MLKLKKSKLIVILLCISLISNLYFLISNHIKNTFTPNLDDQLILAEMTKMVIETEKFQEIASRETVYAIKQGVSRFNVANPSSVFHYEITVQTDRESYIFTCIDEACTGVSNEGWTYSRYSDERPILPFNNKN